MSRASGCCKLPFLEQQQQQYTHAAKLATEEVALEEAHNSNHFPLLATTRVLHGLLYGASTTGNKIVSKKGSTETLLTPCYLTGSVIIIIVITISRSLLFSSQISFSNLGQILSKRIHVCLSSSLRYLDSAPERAMQVGTYLSLQVSLCVSVCYITHLLLLIFNKQRSAEA